MKRTIVHHWPASNTQAQQMTILCMTIEKMLDISADIQLCTCASEEIVESMQPLMDKALALLEKEDLFHYGIAYCPDQFNKPGKPKAAIKVKKKTQSP